LELALESIQLNLKALLNCIGALGFDSLPRHFQEMYHKMAPHSTSAEFHPHKRKRKHMSYSTLLKTVALVLALVASIFLASSSANSSKVRWTSEIQHEMQRLRQSTPLAWHVEWLDLGLTAEAVDSVGLQSRAMPNAQASQVVHSVAVTVAYRLWHLLCLLVD
jgi:hypothetical protein